MSEVYVPTRYKLTIEDYHKLGEAGILDEASRVELIEGELIEMPPIGGPHTWAVSRLIRLLVGALSDTADLTVQSPVLIPPFSEPQPDFVIVRRGTAARDDRVPSPSDVLWVIEVSDSTLRYDQGIKLRLYAQAGIPEYWIVNLKDECVEIYSAPSGEGYDCKTVAKKSAHVSPRALPSVVVDISSIFDKDL